jgi:hypothetical protein
LLLRRSRGSSSCRFSRRCNKLQLLLTKKRIVSDGVCDSRPFILYEVLSKVCPDSVHHSFQPSAYAQSADLRRKLTFKNHRRRCHPFICRMSTLQSPAVLRARGSATFYYRFQPMNINRSCTALIITGLVTGVGATYHYVRIFNSWATHSWATIHYTMLWSYRTQTQQTATCNCN